MQNRPINWGIFISIISLAISLFTFYFSNVRVSHSLKAILAPNYFHESQSDTIEIHYRGIFQNYGNRPETILRSRHFFLTPKNDSVCYNTSDTSFIIKPGEIILKDYITNFFIDSCQKKCFQDGAYSEIITFDLLGKNGRVTSVNILLGNYNLTGKDSSYHLQLVNEEYLWNNKTLVE
ncbi:MAG: hypothetical protein QM737_18545 [Ferruginibacter sp.]